MSDDIRLAICLPLMDEKVYKSFFLSWVNLIKPDNYYLVLPTLNPGCSQEALSYYRNQLVIKSLALDATHIVMMDTDQVYPSETIIRLLEHDLDIVGAKVHRRYPPFDPLLLRGKRDRLYIIPEEEWKNQPLVEVDATGTGCIMYKADVFRSVPQPWYKQLPGGKKSGSVGEDIYFCFKLKEAGYRIFVDTTMEIGHLALIEINRNFYDVVQMARRSGLVKNENSK